MIDYSSKINRNTSFITLKLVVDWHSKSKATLSANLTKKDWISDRLLCTITKEFDTPYGFHQLSNPKCKPCNRLQLCTYEPPIAEPMPQHSHNLCDYSISLLGSLAFCISLRLPRINHCDVVCLHLNTGQKTSVRLFSIPRQFKNWSSPLSFVLNRWMLQISDIKLPHAAVSPNWSKDIPFFGEMYVVYFFVMSDKLGEDSGFFDIPDGAGGIDGAGADEVVKFWVPVEGSEGCWEVIVLNMMSLTFLRLSSKDTSLLSLIFHILRQSPEVASKSGLSPTFVGSKLLHQEWTWVWWEDTHEGS